jgi:hypothetical protein
MEKVVLGDIFISEGEGRLERDEEESVTVGEEDVVN